MSISIKKINKQRETIRQKTIQNVEQFNDNKLWQRPPKKNFFFLKQSMPQQFNLRQKGKKKKRTLTLIKLGNFM